MIAVKKIAKECAVPSGKLHLWFKWSFNSFQLDQMIRDGFLADWGLAIDLREKDIQSNDSALHTRTVSDALFCLCHASEVWQGTYPYLSTELMFGADALDLR